MDYIVSASELYRMSKEILNDGMDYVMISLMDADDELPPAIHFEASKVQSLYEWVDYEEINVADLSDGAQ